MDPQPKEEEENNRGGGGRRVSIWFLFVISASSICVARLDLSSPLQGHGDAGPESEEGQGLGGWLAPGWYFEGATGGVEQPGQQPPA